MLFKSNILSIGFMKSGAKITIFTDILGMKLIKPENCFESPDSDIHIQLVFYTFDIQNRCFSKKS
jgi:hypothetical protein